MTVIAILQTFNAQKVLEEMTNDVRVNTTKAEIEEIEEK